MTPYIGSSAQTPIEVPESTTSTIVKGLTDGTGYTFKVSATNAVGTGPSSTPSNEVVSIDTIFDFATPTIVDSANTSSTELGVQFSSEVPGTVTGIRFYKAATNTGIHVGSLWSSTGTLLASVTFVGETGSGWQQVNFSNPVQINPNTTYVAGYLAPNGHYSETPSAFTTVGVSNPPLQALANPIASNGVYTRSSTSAFPTSTSNATNYWVDVDFVPIPIPGQVTSVSATAGPTSATVKWNAPSSGGPVRTYTITPYIGSEAQPTTTINGSPPATETTIKGLAGGTSYTFTVQASNASGAGPTSEPSNSVTPTGPTAPSPPTGVSASAATKQVLVSWSAPASEGGSPITGYTVTPYIGSSAQTPVHVGPSATSAVLTGLSNGISYTFTVTPANASRRKLAVGRIQRGHAYGHDLRLRHTVDDRLGRRLLGRARCEVQLRTLRLRHRHPLLQGRHQHRYPRRQPLELDRNAARAGDLLRRDPLRLAAGQLLRAGHDHRRIRPM